MANTEKAPAVEKVPVDIKISDVLGMLNNGQDRKEIAKHYGITLATMKEVFKHPKLAGARVKPRTPVNLIDDAPEAAPKKAAVVAPAATTGEAEASTPAPEANAEAAVTQAPAGDKGVW